MLQNLKSLKENKKLDEQDFAYAINNIILFSQKGLNLQRLLFYQQSPIFFHCLHLKIAIIPKKTFICESDKKLIISKKPWHSIFLLRIKIKNSTIFKMEVLSVNSFTFGSYSMKDCIKEFNPLYKQIQVFGIFLSNHFSCFPYIFNMSNFSFNQVKMKNKSDSSTVAHNSSCSYSQIEGSFIDNTFLDKNYLINPQYSTKKANETFFKKVNFEKIKLRPLYIEIQVSQEKSRVKKQAIKNFHSQTSYLQSNLDQIDNRLTINFCQFKKYILENPDEGTHQQYVEWMKTMEDKNFISWFLPLGQRSSRLNSFAISNKTLSLLGYTPNDAALELINFKSNSINSILNNRAYSTLFWVYLNTLCKFMSVELECYISEQDVKLESQGVISTELVGKNQRRIAAEVKIYMPSPFIICMEVVSVAKGEKFYDPQIQLQRKQISQKEVEKNKKQLSHIIKFPKSQEGKQKKMCSYIVIDNYLQ